MRSMLLSSFGLLLLLNASTHAIPIPVPESHDVVSSRTLGSVSHSNGPAWLKRHAEAKPQEHAFTAVFPRAQSDGTPAPGSSATVGRNPATHLDDYELRPQEEAGTSQEPSSSSSTSSVSRVLNRMKSGLFKNKTPTTANAATPPVPAPESGTQGPPPPTRRPPTAAPQAGASQAGAPPAQAPRPQSNTPSVPPGISPPPPGGYTFSSSS